MNKKKVKRVAVFPAGSEIGLEIHDALKYSTFFELVGFSSVACHASFVYKEYYEGLPFYTDSEFINVLNNWIRKYNIDFLYPAYDDVQLFLTEHASDICCDLVTSEWNTVYTCRSKKRTYKYFHEFDFIPKTYDTCNDIEEYPVFIKPDIGQGSQGAKKIADASELIYYTRDAKDVVICEYLSGKEYTVDCFTDKNGILQSCNVRSRARIRNGISVASTHIDICPEIASIADVINGKLKFTGAWFFQLRQTAYGQYKLLEIAPRIAGTMGLSRHLGINYPLLTLFTLMGIEVSTILNSYSISVDRALISRYSLGINYDLVYLDLDDTLVVRGKLNTDIIKFLYQCVNTKKRIVLLTKHINKIEDTLENHKISLSLFDEIIKIDASDQKCNYIHGNAIFIDDSFSERKNVKEKCRIPVFDCSEVDALIDWREE